MDVLLDNLDLYGPGFLNTIKLFALAAIGSLVLGTILAMLRVSPVPVLRAAGAAYVTLFRNTPLTLLFFFFVFAYPFLDIIDLSYFLAAVVALTLYTAAFVCEVVRSGINTVPVGQAEAARAIGLTFGQNLGSIILPQAIRSVMPPMMSTMIALLKNTTIAAGFSVVEAGAIYGYLSERGYSVMTGLLWVALGFVILVTPLTLLQRGLEKRWSVAR
ncbi:amino acid ABC transporter permease [Prauserella rugosa]|uniref:Glutamate transport system permease protein n=1 Tax=Prauserella rugosa TaxID=43354 RepID=A0A660C4E0_9PSEU|nr:amino acid ABC transporter permease [Prauserella rugosa]KID29643.1 amine acid ABC transporter, permease protein, 3-TM region, His/Glu/Gln/Arg/opine family [Prauserella sp. Am3]KMS91385.1 amino acid ABC transporter permease [Streptomyces regensis]TWH18408.1 glutamate transport system permease protein [Prauserella rugosa]